MDIDVRAMKALVQERSLSWDVAASEFHDYIGALSRAASAPEEVETHG